MNAQAISSSTAAAMSSRRTGRTLPMVMSENGTTSEYWPLLGQGYCNSNWADACRDSLDLIKQQEAIKPNLKELGLIPHDQPFGHLV
jgi:hypothetical protein